MTNYVALLRAVNLGKRQLRMEDLRRIASELKLEAPRTYIASGNLLFTSERSETAVKTELEKALREHMGAPVAVMVRTDKEMRAVEAANPFKQHPGNRVVAIFLDHAPPKDAADKAKNLSSERIVLGKREVYVHYPDGQGRSKLSIPAAANGTARNMKTVQTLAEMAGAKA